MSTKRKRCTFCGEDKPATAFYNNRGHRDGLSTYCKPCTLADRRRTWRAKHPEPPPYEPPAEKACTKCGEVKPLDQFHRRKAARDGRQTYCAICATALALAFNKRNPEYHRQAARLHAARHPDRKADNSLKWRLGVPYGTYDRIFAEQDGKCAICGTTDPGSGTKRLHMDHNGVTGQIRGLLCGSCNNGIGRFSHDPIRIINAAAYLKKWILPE